MLQTDTASSLSYTYNSNESTFLSHSTIGYTGTNYSMLVNIRIRHHHHRYADPPLHSRIRHIGIKVIAYNPRRRCGVSVSGCWTRFLCLHGVMRTRSNRAPERGLCGARMKKNGHDRLGRQAGPLPLRRTGWHDTAPPMPKQTGPSTEMPRNPVPQSNRLTCTCPSSTPEREVQSK